MKKITFLILTVLFFSCKKEVKKTITPITKIIKTDSIIYSSANFEPYLKLDPDFSEYQIIGLTNPELFTTNEISFPVKENDFDFDKSDDFRYFTAANFDLNKIICKVITYTSYGENGSKVLNIQLNSYLSGLQSDALLLDCRFTFEIEYYRQFTIKKNGTVTIKKWEIDGLLYNNEGDIIGKKSANDTTTAIVNYKIDAKGHFIKY